MFQTLRGHDGLRIMTSISFEMSEIICKILIKIVIFLVFQESASSFEIQRNCVLRGTYTRIALIFFRTKTRCLEENEEKHERERKTRKKKENNREAPMAVPSPIDFRGIAH